MKIKQNPKLLLWYARTKAKLNNKDDFLASIIVYRFKHRISPFIRLSNGIGEIFNNTNNYEN